MTGKVYEAKRRVNDGAAGAQRHEPVPGNVLLL